MRGLSFRRHQWRRARGRAVRQLRWLFTSDSEWITGKLIARWAVDRTPCSCWMCGNPRRYTGARTRQEQRALLRFEESTGETAG